MRYQRKSQANWGAMDCFKPPIGVPIGDVRAVGTSVYPVLLSAIILRTTGLTKTRYLMPSSESSPRYIASVRGTQRGPTAKGACEGRSSGVCPRRLGLHPFLLILPHPLGDRDSGYSRGLLQLVGRQHVGRWIGANLGLHQLSSKGEFILVKWPYPGDRCSSYRF
jgi:hypothetical protein